MLPAAPVVTAVHRSRFMAAALGMSWQLALVVIVPIAGGSVLDGHYHTAPWLTLAGLAVAAAGVFGILSRVAGEQEQERGTGSHQKGDF